MRLVLVRHGETAWNREGRFQGQSPVDLNERGVAQARQLAKALVPMKPAAIYSSPLPRTLMTADEISRELSLPVVPASGLKEVNLGDMEGITGAEMRTRFAEVYSAWREDASDVVFPGGESIRQLQERAWRAILDIENANVGNVIVVSHNFAIRSILCRFLGLPLSRFHMLRVDLASISILQSRPRARQVVSINDKCHLTHDALHND